MNFDVQRNVIHFIKIFELNGFIKFVIRMRLFELFQVVILDFVNLIFNFYDKNCDFPGLKKRLWKNIINTLYLEQSRDP